MRRQHDWMPRIGIRRAGTRGALLILAIFTACSRTTQLPAADQPQQLFPDIGGTGVMLLPVQRIIPAIGLPASADTTRPPAALTPDALSALQAELVYWLPERAPRSRWVPPEAVEKAARGSAALQIAVRDLPVAEFQQAELRRIGDPLYGDLRRLAVVTDARLALVPLGAVWIPETGGKGRVHVAAVLIDTPGGNVIWHGVAAGALSDFDDHSALASTAQALASLIPR